MLLLQEIQCCIWRNTGNELCCRRPQLVPIPPPSCKAEKENDKTEENWKIQIYSDIHLCQIYHTNIFICFQLFIEMYSHFCLYQVLGYKYIHIFVCIKICHISLNDLLSHIHRQWNDQSMRLLDVGNLCVGTKNWQTLGSGLEKLA